MSRWDSPAFFSSNSLRGDDFSLQQVVPAFKVARASSILRGLLHGLVQLLIDLRRLDFGEQLAGGAYSKTADWAALRCGRLDHRPESASSEAAAKAVLEQLKAHAGAH
jgi:hypothetical protein